jgi:hypothetical protein
MHSQLENPMRSWELQKKAGFGRRRRSHSAKMNAAARQIPSEINQKAQNGKLLSMNELARLME